MLIEIDPLTHHPEYSDLVTGWLHTEWNADRDEIAALLQASQDRPGAILAMNQGSPIGVLAYKRHREKFQFATELWINALYVLPDFRRRGVGRKLVVAGSSLCFTHRTRRIFVYTDVPSLYVSCGWEHIQSDKENRMQILVLDAVQ